MNSVVISGNLCTDPEKRVTQNGISQVTVRLGVQREYKDPSTGRRETDFINVVAWRQSADFLAQYARRGDKVSVKGTIQTRSYEKDGVKHYITEINADRVELDKRRENTAHNNAPQPASDTSDTDFSEVPNDNLPF